MQQSHERMPKGLGQHTRAFIVKACEHVETWAWFSPLKGETEFAVHVQTSAVSWPLIEEKNEQFGWKQLKWTCRKRAIWKTNGFQKSPAPEHLPQDRVSVAVMARVCVCMRRIDSSVLRPFKRRQFDVNPFNERWCWQVLQDSPAVHLFE